MSITFSNVCTGETSYLWKGVNCFITLMYSGTVVKIISFDNGKDFLNKIKELE